MGFLYVYFCFNSYYSNNFVDFEKQLATDLFLRIFRPGAGPLVLPPEGEWHHPEDAVAVAAAVSVRSGQAFIVSSDPAFEAYIHWLQAWATLPPYRAPITAWFPQSILFPRQCALRGYDIWTTASMNVKIEEEEKSTSKMQKHFQLLELPENDPGADWYSELYRPYDWTHFYDSTYHQLPLATNENGSKQKRSLLNSSHIDPLISSRVVGDGQSRRDGLFSEMIVIEEEEEKGPDGSSWNTKWTGTAVAHASSPFSSINNKGDTSSSDSTSQDSDTSAISKCISQHEATRSRSRCRRQPSFFLTETLTPALSDGDTSPLLSKFTRVRLSDLAGWTQHGKGSTVKRFKRPLQGEEIEDGKRLSHRKDSGFNVPKFGLDSSSTFIKLRKPSIEDMAKYRKYASIPMASVDVSPADILTVSSASISIYRSTVELSQTGTCSIAGETILMYQKFMNVEGLIL